MSLKPNIADGNQQYINKPYFCTGTVSFIPMNMSQSHLYLLNMCAVCAFITHFIDPNQLTEMLILSLLLSNDQ